MDNGLLKNIGALLYGVNFRSAMARDLGVTDRTVRRWLAGEFELSNTHISKLLVLLDSRDTRIKEVQKVLQKEMAARYRRHVQGLI